MNRALALARRGHGLVEPNPMVGAVIVRDEHIVAEGYHRRFGGPHAEIEALDACRAARIDPAGLTMYVTLEPCCVHRKTPACTEALIEARLARVVASILDPDPAMAGAGIAALRGAGIQTEVGLGADRSRRLNEPYFKRRSTELPWVIAKWAQTLDGKIATSNSDSKWISSEASRKRAHDLRARVDAVLVGIGTVQADDPLLTARGVPLKRTARRVVVDPNLRISPDAQLLRQPNPPVLLATREISDGKSFRQIRGIDVIGLPVNEDGQLDLRYLLVYLANHHDATNVLVEGGAVLVGSMLRQNLVDQLIVFQAPKIIGDSNAISSVSGLSCPTIGQTLSTVLRSVNRVGDDLILDYRVIR